MTLLEDLISYCVSNSLLVGDGEDAFRDFLPESPDACVAFIEYSGSPVHPVLDYVHRSVQVVVRCADAESAHTKASQLCNIFKSQTESLRIDFSETTWGQVYIRQTPFRIDQDESDRVIYGFNLGITTNNLE